MVKLLLNRINELCLFITDRGLVPPISDVTEGTLKAAFEAMGLQDFMFPLKMIESRPSHHLEDTILKDSRPTVESTDGVSRAPDGGILNEGTAFSIERFMESGNKAESMQCLPCRRL